MIKIYTRPGCAFCPTVKKFCEAKGAQYEELPAEGAEYMNLARNIGYNVPLVTSTKGTTVMMGLQIPQLMLIVEEDRNG